MGVGVGSGGWRWGGEWWAGGGGGGALTSNVVSIWCHILIQAAPWVFLRLMSPLLLDAIVVSPH